MKTLRYLLIICTLTMAAVAFGQAQFKTSENKAAFDYQVGKTHFEFYSTSTLAGSGSSLPIAARNGLTIGANAPDDNVSGCVGVRRAKKDGEPDPFGGGTINDTPTPQEPGSPVGEGMWALLLMAAGFAFGKWRYQMMLRCRKETA